jgi:hypothetical protein
MMNADRTRGISSHPLASYLRFEAFILLIFYWGAVFLLRNRAM